MKTFVIAEAGVNHNGQWELGLDLIDAAKRAGADAVKFQMFNSHRLWGDDRIQHLELSEDALTAMHAHCREVGIEFMCTPFGVPEVRFLAPMLRRVKVASGCLDRATLLEAIRETALPVIVSTGMNNLTEIRHAMNTLGFGHPNAFRQHYTLLHCTSAYPCPLEQVNLAAMDTLRGYYGDRAAIGYSDHTDGITVALAAVARGAEVIEKHLTLDRQAKGPDHKASIDPIAFATMVGMIREVEAAIGQPEKVVQPAEAEVRKAWYGD